VLHDGQILAEHASIAGAKISSIKLRWRKVPERAQLPMAFACV
jgi:hypothetical protein